MELKDLLSQKKTSVMKRWYDLIMQTYPAETAMFLQAEKDPFANPVGSTIYRGMEGIYEGLLRETDPEGVSGFLDSIIRVRAVQDFTPSEAVSFVFLLKDVLREELKDDVDPEGLLVLGSRIDALALSAFDIYVRCREKLYELKANELRNWTSKLIERAAKAGGRGQ